MSDDSRHPWDPQQGETPAAFEAFCVYRDAPAGEQTHRDIALKRYGTATKTQVQRMGHWSSDHHWADRAKAYRQHQIEMEQAAIQAALLEERKQAARERLETGRLGVKFAYKWILKNYITAEDVAASSIPALLKVCADMARIEDGLSTERIDQTMRAITVKDLTDEELLRYIQE